MTSFLELGYAQNDNGLARLSSIPGYFSDSTNVEYSTDNDLAIADDQHIEGETRRVTE